MSIPFYPVAKALTPPIIIDLVKRLSGNNEGKKGSSAKHVDRVVRSNHREAVGGLWDEIGELQFKLLVERGLRPSDRLLDVGCGSLRGGVHFINYLESEHYFGVDKSENLLRAGSLIELPRHKIGEKQFHIECRSDFDFSVFDEEFNFVIAQSLFTHLSWNSIALCLANIGKVLHRDGAFFATFFEDPDEGHTTSSITHEPGGIVTYSHRDPYHYSFSVFKELAHRYSLDVEYIGDWNHPRHQMLIVFHKDGYA